MANTIDSNPARQFLGLDSIPTADEMHEHAKRRGMAAERAAKEKRQRLGKAVRKAAFATSAVLAAASPNVHEAAGDAADAVKGAVTAPVEWANDRIGSDRVFHPEQGNPDNAEQVVRHGQTEGAQLVERLQAPEQ